MGASGVAITPDLVLGRSTVESTSMLIIPQNVLQLACRVINPVSGMPWLRIGVLSVPADQQEAVCGPAVHQARPPRQDGHEGATHLLSWRRCHLRSLMQPPAVLGTEPRYARQEPVPLQSLLVCALSAVQPFGLDRSLHLTLVRAQSLHSTMVIFPLCQRRALRRCGATTACSCAT